MPSASYILTRVLQNIPTFLFILVVVFVLVRLLPQINEAFGLSPGQIERLAPDRQVVVYKVLTAGGGLVACIPPRPGKELPQQRSQLLGQIVEAWHAPCLARPSPATVTARRRPRAGRSRTGPGAR